MHICPNETVLSTHGVCKAFGGRRVIDDISIVLHKRESVSLLGVSGVGKTTLFNIIAGITRPDDGVVMLEGRDITGRIGQIGYMRQTDLLLPYKRVIDNVSLPLVIGGAKKADARERAKAFFEKYGLSGCEYLYPSQLSGGMRQRAALLRTYFLGKNVMLLDEPFSALDTITKAAMHSWFLDVTRDMGLSTLFITHDIDEAIFLSDRIYIMRDSPGRIAWEIKVETPSTKADFKLSTAFLDYKRDILTLLSSPDKADDYDRQS